jgi:uncharacterized protein YndB with AHSA1/START domain
MTQASDEPELQDALSFGYELDASPAKVWRALTVPEFVAQWLTARIVEPDAETREPKPHLSSPSITLLLLASEPGRSIRYLWREEGSSFSESIVTFRLSPNDTGGTTFRIVHEPTAAIRLLSRPRPANLNAPRLLLAA